jgi:hypothetical protein
MGKAIKFNFNKKSYNSFTELCNDYNLSEGCVRARLKRKWSIKEALGIKFRKSASGGRDKNILVNGQNYKSIKIACEKLGITNLNKVYQRLRKQNYTIEQAFGLVKPPKKKSSTAIKITVGNQTFESKRAASIFFKVDEKIVSQRIKRGWSVEEAHEIKDRSPQINKIYLKNGNKKQGYIYIISNNFNNKQYVGITIGSIKERFNSHIYKADKRSHKDSLEHDIWKNGSEKFFYKKLKKAPVDKLGSLERYYIKKMKTKIPYGYNINSGGAGIFGGINYKIPIVVDNEIFFSLSDIARSLNINVSTISARIRSGWDIKKAISQKIRSIKKIKFDNVEYESINDAARSKGLKVSTVTGRIKSGWTIKKALSTIPKEKKNTHLLPYFYKNKKFSNFSDLARSVGIKPKTLTARLRNGVNIKEALNNKNRLKYKINEI